MGFFERHVVAVTSDASGDVTDFTAVGKGVVQCIRYVPASSNELATGADIVVTAENSGLTVLTQANIGTSSREWYPRSPVHAVSDGSASLYASGGEATEDRIPVASERIKIVVSNGGNAKSGTFHVFIGG